MAQNSLTEDLLRKHPEYLDKGPLYGFLRASYNGGPEYISDANLHPHTFEDSTSYGKRLKRAYFYNYCAPIVNAYQSFLYRQEVKRDYGGLEEDPLFAAFLDNADRGGNTYSEVVRDAAKWSSVSGITYWLVDKPGQTAPTLQGELEEKLYPYIVHIHPEDITDWSVDGDGDLIWVKIRERRVVSDNFRDAPKPLERYTIWTREDWSTYEIRAGSNKKQEAVLVETAAHQLKEVPLVQVVHYSEGPMCGLSLLSDIAFVNRALFNWCSLLDEILYRQTFSQLVFPEDPKNPLGDIELGTAKGFGFPPESSHPPAFISPDASQAQVLMQQITAGVEEIYRLATLRGAIGVTEQSSGVARSYDFVITNNTLASKALNMEAAETKAIDLWAKWQGKSDADVRIDYPHDFDITSLQDELADLLQVQTLKISRTFEEILKEQVVKKMLPKLDQETMKLIREEIKAGPPTPQSINPLQTAANSIINQGLVDTPNVPNPPGTEPEEEEEPEG